ncbi:hypothetical protein [Streptomyces aidingensis]|uniref:Uncharacterized protein n=1 Tax=Streptomyces aidingensis TaxID=910347 RepID=A0A1I1UTT4_9ACTN|nr:hypothetical protein [Streptomyces aidingensis]SFD74242.1 hypothetical protein SAMN05421773_12712 [Streptomyces aidingensis]
MTGRWTRDAARLYASGRAPEEIATRLCTDEHTALALARSGMLPLAVERLEQLLGDEAAADDWIDARVADYVEQDLLDPDAALMVIALAVCAHDALVLARPGQQWTVRPECAGDPALPQALTLTARTGPQAEARGSDGRDGEIDLYLLTTYYRLAAWHHEGQEV